VRPDGGVVIVDDMPVYDNVTVRKRLFLVPDEPFCPGYMTARGLAGFYATQYEGYDEEMLRKDLDFCDIPMDIPLRKTDKDLRSLVHLAVGVSLGIKYLICDDIFTGMSEKCLSLAGRIISEAVSERSISVVIALEDPAVLPNISGNTYELETVC
jgi:ABC-type multidrug transport system ATPase subunit